MKIVAYIVAAILVFFGVLFIWGAFSPGIDGLDFDRPDQAPGIGLVIIYFAAGAAVRLPGFRAILVQRGFAGQRQDGYAKVPILRGSPDARRHHHGCRSAGCNLSISIPLTS